VLIIYTKKETTQLHKALDDKAHNMLQI